MKNLKLYLILLFTGVIMAALGCVGAGSEQRGSIAGTVFDVNNRPVSGAKITAGGSSAVSDYYGAWFIDSAPADSITVTASHKSYRSASLTINVEKGRVTNGVNFMLSSNGDIYDVFVKAISPTSAEVIFNTSRAAKSYVDYGLNSLLNQRAHGPDKYLLTHRFTVSGLKPASSYRFRCMAADKNSIEMQSDIFNLTTPPTKLPITPSELKISKVANSNVVSLAWHGVLSPDSAGYNVYRSLLKDGPFEKIALVNGEAYLDSDVSAGEKYYYKVSALSSFGVESALSEAVGFVVSGVVSKSVVWNAQKSPYILNGDLIVSAGASLIINKNTRVLISDKNKYDNTSKPISIVVDGSLTINGGETEHVLIAPNAGGSDSGSGSSFGGGSGSGSDSGSGSSSGSGSGSSSGSGFGSGSYGYAFEGITFSQQADLGASLIKGLSISFAKTAITGEAGLPKICFSSFSACKTGIKADKNAKESIEVVNCSFNACENGIFITDNDVKVKIADNLFKQCSRGCVCTGNRLAEITGNRAKYSGLTAFEVGSKASASIFKLNIVGWNSSGAGLVLTGKDEIRKNTLHAMVGIEVSETAESPIRSNLILVSKNSGGKGVLYTGQTPYKPATATNTFVIQNNAVFNLSKADKYVNSDLSLLTATGDITFSAAYPLELAGNSPFEGIISETFDYTPLEGSVLKNAGFDGDDIGAIDVPD